MEGAARLAIPAGTTVHREGETDPHLELVAAGLVRVYISAADGRTSTLRYCRTGALIGAVTLYARGFTRPFGIQALADSVLIRLRPDVVRACADQDLAVARALLDEMSERVAGYVEEFAATTFASVRHKVARHLLDLASDRNENTAELVARISQQELADAVGTAREVVVRVLRDLREAGLAETRRGSIVILDAERLLDTSRL